MTFDSDDEEVATLPLSAVRIIAQATELPNPYEFDEDDQSDAELNELEDVNRQLRDELQAAKQYMGAAHKIEKEIESTKMHTSTTHQILSVFFLRFSICRPLIYDRLREACLPRVGHAQERDRRAETGRKCDASGRHQEDRRRARMRQTSRARRSREEPRALC
jgi:hypothetical protein